MDPQPGTVMRVRAGRPLVEAANHFCKGAVKEGLECLSPQALSNALDEGFQEAARRVGVSARAMAALLPTDERAEVLRAVETSYAAAQAVRTQMGDRLGGFLLGVVEVTVDAEHADAGYYLDRLAAKLSRDPGLSGPLDDLAGAITRYERMLDDLVPRIGAERRLRRAYHLKLARRGVAALVLLGIAASFLVYAVGISQARGRVSDVLSAQDACEAFAIDEGDLEQARGWQVVRAYRARASCLATKARADAEQRCRALEEGTRKGSLGSGLEATAGSAWPLLGRMAAGELATSDFASKPSFPCGGFGVDKELSERFAQVAAEDAPRWAELTHIEPSLAARFREGRPAPSPSAKKALSEAAEPVAERAVLRGQKDDLERAKSLCALHDAVGMPRGKWCAALAVALAR